MRKNIMRNVGIGRNVDEVISQNYGLIKKPKSIWLDTPLYTPEEQARVDTLDAGLNADDVSDIQSANMAAGVIDKLATRRRRVRTGALVGKWASVVAGVRLGVEVSDSIEAKGVLEVATIIGVTVGALIPVDFASYRMLKTDGAVMQHAMQSFNEKMNGTDNLGSHYYPEVKKAFTEQIIHVLDSGAEKTPTLGYMLNQKAHYYESLAEANTRPVVDPEPSSTRFVDIPVHEQRWN